MAARLNQQSIWSRRQGMRT